MQLNKKPTKVEVSLNTVYFLTFWGSQYRAGFTLWALLEVHINLKDLDGLIFAGCQVPTKPLYHSTPPSELDRAEKIRWDTTRRLR